MGQVVAEVFQPIGIFHAPMMHTPEADGEPGIPHLSVGLYPTIDDVAKLATLLQHGGRHQGHQLLSAAKLAEALYQTKVMGLPSRCRTGSAWAAITCRFGRCPIAPPPGASSRSPYAAGWGGNVVVLLPNGISAFRFADGDHYDVNTMVLAGETIRPFPCPADSGEAPPPERPAAHSERLTRRVGRPHLLRRPR